MRTSSLILAILLACLSSNSFSEGFAASKLPAYSSAHKKKSPNSCLSTQEMELITLVNQYRVQSGFAPVQVSRSLVKVARLHVADLQQHRPDRGKDRRGMPCTMHSWSPYGNWIPGCYTNDHYYADLMRDKPREITANAYDDVGYEIIYWRSGSQVVPEEAIEGWFRSQNHRALLFETGRWAGIHFKVVGAGISDNYISLWFGPTSDPRGSLPPCDNGSR